VDQEVAQLIQHTIDIPVLAEAVERQEAADAADTLETLEDQEAAEVLHRMDTRAAAEALAEMEGPLAVGVIADLVEEGRGAYASELLAEMAPDDAADLLQALSGDVRDEVLATIDPGEKAGLEALIQYEEESAGGIMTTDVLALPSHLTVAEATDSIRASRVPDQTRFAMVIDPARTLLGTVGLRRLLLARPRERLQDIMRPVAKVVHPDMDREQVARAFDRYDYEMLPVVDEANRLLGIVTVDDVIDIIRAEHTEDVQKTVGAGAGEAVYSGIRVKCRGRLPWLSASLIMTCVAAFVVLFFEELVRDHTILAFLLPVIAALVGNAGHQALAVTLRGIVLGEVRRERVWTLVWREGLAGLVNGVALGLLLALAIWMLSLSGRDVDPRIGVIAGFATAIAMAVGTLAGASIPIIMKRAGVDPAQSSAIFLIMITDAVSFSVLLGLVSAALGV
jgi:magnesium transporter